MNKSLPTSLHRNTTGLTSPLIISILLHILILVVSMAVGWKFEDGRSAPLRGNQKYVFEVDAPGAQTSRPAPLPLQEKQARPLSKSGAIATSTETSRDQSPATEGVTDTVARGTPGEETGTITSARERYLLELSSLLDRKLIYPMTSRRLGETGSVLLRFRILRDGRIERASVLSPSPYPRLNEAALKLITELARFHPLPDVLNQDYIDVEQPIRYTPR